VTHLVKVLARGRPYYQALKCDCGNPACETSLELNQTCHPKAGLGARFWHEGFVVLYCLECGKHGARVNIASTDETFEIMEDE
jgi:hypothetical protein